MKKILFGIFAAIVFVACNKTESKTTEASVPENASNAYTPSAIEAASASGMNSSPTSYATPQPQSAAAANVKLNPPHGEPGHLCEIAVGAPLPADGLAPQPVVDNTPTRPTPINPGATSVLNTQLNTVVPTGPKPKFNPAHGQPWHTCDLEVGAVLP